MRERFVSDVAAAQIIKCLKIQHAIVFQPALSHSGRSTIMIADDPQFSFAHWSIYQADGA
jgi:hypothetical protein